MTASNHSRMDAFAGVATKTIRLGDDGKLRNCHVVMCSGCTEELRVPFNGRSAMPPEGIAQKARQAGWTWSKKGKHLCPECGDSGSRPTVAAEPELEPGPPAPQSSPDCPISQVKVRAIRYVEVTIEMSPDQVEDAVRTWLALNTKEFDIDAPIRIAVLGEARLPRVSATQERRETE